MRAEELRIGNLIFDPKRGTVKGMPARYVNHRIISDMASNPDQDYFKPILLTEEWLLKFGAKKISDIVYSIELYRMGESFYAIKLTYHADNWKWWLDTHFQTRINYVHQLQNLYYALTGKELTL